MSLHRDIPHFTHLHVHSSYSIGLGISAPADICAHAKRAGYSAVALTDTNGTYGYLEFHEAAKRYGLKPIYGAVIYHTSVIDPGRDRFALTVIALDSSGLSNVSALATLSAAATESSVGLLLEQLGDHTDGIVAFTGGSDSEIANLLLAGDDSGAAEVVLAFRKILGERFFVEIQDHGDKEGKALVRKLIGLADSLETRAVLTQEVRYGHAETRALYQLLNGIRHPHAEADFFRIGADLPNRSLTPERDIARLAVVYPKAYANNWRIAERVEGDLLDVLDEGDGGTLFEPEKREGQALVARCTEGFYRMYPNLSNTEISHYQSIIRREAHTIEQAGVIRPLMLYHAITSHVRRAGVPLGPATGANLQSLCAYVLGITSFDPYRIEPDFRPMFARASELELQLPSGRRHQVVRLLGEVIGTGSVAYLPAVERITPARAVRMVASVVDAPEADVENILRIVARHPGASIKQMSEQDRQLGSLYKDSLPARELLRRAALLEHLPCGFIRSRRSVAVSPVPLERILGHTVDADSGDVFLHCSRDVVPVSGVFRIDFTPLSALAVSVRGDELLKNRGIDPAWDRLPLDDGPTWREIREGDPTGVFLLEGETMQGLREAFGVETLNDLTNFLAVMRQRRGERNPLSRVRAFRSAGKLAEEGPEGVEAILRPTGGHILYEEQLRDIAMSLTGKPSHDALEIIAELQDATPASLSTVRGRFMHGTADANVPMDVANLWFERLLYFADKTMGRERVRADALLVYKLMYLKTHHPEVFYVSLLNAYWSNESKRRTYLDHVRAELDVLPVDINRSDVLFTLEDGSVRTGFCAVNGFGLDDAIRIVKARGRKHFASLEAFLKRLKAKTLSRQVVRKLIRAGAFDSTGKNHKELLAIHSKLTKTEPIALRKAREAGQLELPLGETRAGEGK